MCLADDDLAGSQLCPGTPSSLPRDKLVSNPLSLYCSLRAFQSQHASSGHDKIIISALRNFQDDKPKEKEEQPLPSFFDNENLHFFEVGTDHEIEPETTPPVKRLTRSKGASPGPTQQKLQLYVLRKLAARALHRLLINAVDERARLPPWSQTTQDSCGMSPTTTRLRLQYLARLPSRLDHRASDAEE